MSFLSTCQLLFLLLIDRFNVTQAGKTVTAHSISKLLKVAKIRYWYIHVIMQPMSKGVFWNTGKYNFNKVQKPEGD